MAALTAASRRVKREANQITIAIVDTVQVFVGSYVAIDTSVGRVRPITDAANREPLGFVTGFDPTGQTDGSATGNTAGTVKAIVEIDRTIVEGVDVGGVTAETNVGDFVFATSDNDFTNVATTNTPAVGEVTRFDSATRQNVLFFAHEEMRQQ